MQLTQSQNPILAWATRAEGFLDARGRWAWIASTVLAFALFWPLGLGLLAYALYTGRLKKAADRGGIGLGATSLLRPSGNAAFEAHKRETLRKLEDEQRAFEEFLSRLREAKDKQEFDQFMESRDRKDAPIPNLPAES